ncbi:DUF2075 domain-containing protein [Pseudomonas alkylphenolica]|uniref:DUF2075 domain-containing protein n=1 Tax=Pseudomonas alkylphenolica TaxID=237609 RepID=UPI003393C768
MIVYQATKLQFLDDIDNREIEEVIRKIFKDTTGKAVAPKEVDSWRNSLSHMARVLRDKSIPDDMGVAVELHVPQTSKRIDFTLTGFNEVGTKHALLVELKQWTKATDTNKDAIVATALGKGIREVVHPSYQAWSYATLFEGFNEAVYSGNITIRPCAYLHNYVRDGIIDAAHYNDYITKAPLFLRGEDELAQMRAFIKQHIVIGDSNSVLHELVSSRIRPSKALSDALTRLLAAQPEFILIDDQKEIYEAAMAAAKAVSSEQTRVVIIEGGPGTGKTVLALNLLVNLIALGLSGKYVSKNAAPRKVYESKLVGSIKRSHFSNLFVGSGAFVKANLNEYDVLVVDEAHRLTEKSDMYGIEGDNQIKELINASKCTIFLIDEDQRVTLKDIGNKQAIREFAKTKGAVIEEYSLTSQFRCSGSDGYLAWLDHILQIRPTANTHLNGEEYEFKVFHTPESLHEAIKEKNGNNKARVVAGYCWPWSSKKQASADDIVIGDNYRRQWNLTQDGSLWIVSKESVDQVGCIHTCQGLEVDYIGVIIGPDLVVRDGQVVTDAKHRANQDRSVFGYKKMMKEDPLQTKQDLDLIIKNTYRTLMTRGMKGCYVYSTDQETAAYLRSRLRAESRETQRAIPALEKITC